MQRVICHALQMLYRCSTDALLMLYYALPGAPGAAHDARGLDGDGYLLLLPLGAGAHWPREEAHIAYSLALLSNTSKVWVSSSVASRSSCRHRRRKERAADGLFFFL